MMTSSALTYEDAFELLCGRVDKRLESIQARIAEVVDEGAYEQAEEYVKRAQSLAQLRDDLDELAERFEELLESAGTGETTRLQRGLKTPQEAYRVPILRTLMEMGGQGDINSVLGRVRELMEGELNQYDLALLSSGEMPRWRNTAQWARNAMREEGLIRDDTPRGVWAISDEGRRWLKSQSEEKTI